MSVSIFRSAPRRWSENSRDGHRAKIIPAELRNHQEEIVPGVALFTGGKPRLVIPMTDALRLAHQIADLATEQKETAA